MIRTTAKGRAFTQRLPELGTPGYTIGVSKECPLIDAQILSSVRHAREVRRANSTGGETGETLRDGAVVVQVYGTAFEIQRRQP